LCAEANKFWPILLPITHIPVTFLARAGLFKHATKPGEPAFVAIRLRYNDRDDNGFGDYSALFWRRTV
jgi:hypothetical protein